MDNMPMVKPSTCRMCQAKDDRIAALQREIESLRKYKDVNRWFTNPGKIKPSDDCDCGRKKHTGLDCGPKLPHR